MRFKTAEDKYDFLNFLSAFFAGISCTGVLTLLLVFGLTPITFAFPALLLGSGITLASGISAIDKLVRFTKPKGRVTWADPLEIKYPCPAYRPKYQSRVYDIPGKS